MTNDHRPLTFESELEFALALFDADLRPVPWESAATNADAYRDWLAGLSEDEIERVWTHKPLQRVAIIVPDNAVLLEASDKSAAATLRAGLESLSVFAELDFMLPDGCMLLYRLIVGANVSGDFPDGIIVHGPGSVVLMPLADDVELRVGTARPAMDKPVTPAAPLPVAAEPEPSELRRFSLRGRGSELARLIVDSVYVLGAMVLLGQFTAIFAPPNTGKTLLMLYLLIQSILAGRINPANVYYINVDDTGQGLIEKLDLADEHRFEMISEGYFEFSAKGLLAIIEEITNKGDASKNIIILDTLKRFTDVMSKREVSRFTAIARRFGLRGGTLIVLGHVNKKPGANGKLIYAGTSDIVDDADCCYILEEVASQDGVKVVEFRNIKRRGGNVLSAAYSYSLETGLSYSALLASVEEVDPEKLEPIKQEAAKRDDAELIAIVEACIRDGVTMKMALMREAAKRAGVSHKTMVQLIERYTGTDPTAHHWQFTVHERGAKVFELLEKSPQAEP